MSCLCMNVAYHIIKVLHIVFVSIVQPYPIIYLSVRSSEISYMSQLLLLGKFEYGGGPIFKVVLECLKRCSEPFLIYIYGIQCDFMSKSC